MTDHWITSIGIDIGTSTTKFIVSRLRLEKTSRIVSLPRLDIVERKLLYESEVQTTPLLSEEEIDLNQVSEIIQWEYKKAQLDPSDIHSGAVIITGESANKKNARHVLHVLADRAGDFVVATAGAVLEGILAGKGSGAEKRSKEIRGIIANIDIGGGTANVAFFEKGKVLGTVTYHVGGRLIRLTREGIVQYISPAIQPWLKEISMPLQTGQTVSYEQLYQVAAQMSQSMMNDVKSGTISSCLLQSTSIPLCPPIKEVMISGGVGHMLAQAPPATISDTARYGDFGPLLAYAFKRECENHSFSLIPAEHTVRATVIGAGMQSMQISGATIFVEASLVPMKNVPVLKLDLTDQELTEDIIRTEVTRGLERGAQLFDPESSPPFAIALTGITICTYSILKVLSRELADGYRRLFPDCSAMVVICEQDMAKALGQSLTLLCEGRPRILCIDQISVEHGDYMDLGEPIAGKVIPVVIKTLAFY